MCTGHTRHVEVYNLKFDGDEQTYEDLVKHFFMFHDPTTLNQQGNDIGTQYASAIFCSDQKQVIILGCMVHQYTKMYFLHFGAETVL